MLETVDNIGYEEWDDESFSIPQEFQLDENSSLQNALNVFYAAGGLDFFNVVNPAKYASNWLNFIGDLYAAIEEGAYQSDGTQYTLPLSDEERQALIEQGVPEIFTTDF